MEPGWTTGNFLTLGSNLGVKINCTSTVPPRFAIVESGRSAHSNYSVIVTTYIVPRLTRPFATRMFVINDGQLSIFETGSSPDLPERPTGDPD